MKIIYFLFVVIAVFSASAYAKGGAQSMHTASTPIPVELAVNLKPSYEQGTVILNLNHKNETVTLPWLYLGSFPSINVPEEQKTAILTCFQNNFSIALQKYVNFYKREVQIEATAETSIEGNALKWIIDAKYTGGGWIKSTSISRIAGYIAIGERRAASKITFWENTQTKQSVWYLTESLETENAKSASYWLDKTSLKIFQEILSRNCMTAENLNGKTLTGEVLLLEPDALVTQTPIQTSSHNLAGIQSCLKGERVWFGRINRRY